MEHQPRRTRATRDLDVFPHDAVGMAGAERLHRRFFCGEAAGEVGSRVSAAGTIGDLAFGEHATQEPIAVSFDSLSEPRDVGGIEANPQNGHESTQA